MSDSVRPHRWQPTRLPRPWGPPGKNTAVNCHFLLQCMKVKMKSLSRVRLLATPWTAAHQAPLSMGFSRQEYWSELPLPSPTPMTSVLIKGRFGYRHTGRMPHDHGGRGWSYSATSQGLPTSTKKLKKMHGTDSPWPPQEGTNPVLFQTSGLQNCWRIYISIVCSHQVSGTLLWQLQEASPVMLQRATLK